MNRKKLLFEQEQILFYTGETVEDVLWKYDFKNLLRLKALLNFINNLP